MNSSSSSGMIKRSSSLCVFLLLKCLFFDLPSSSSSVSAFTSSSPTTVFTRTASTKTTFQHYVATTPPPPSSSSSWYNGTEITSKNNRPIVPIRESATTSSLSDPTTTTTSPNKERSHTSPSSSNNNNQNGIIEIINQNAKQRQRNFVRFANLLSLHSGFLNAIFLSGVVGRIQAVGPVTDSWTKFGLAVSSFNLEKTFFVFRTLTSFGLGALITGMLLTPSTTTSGSEKNGSNQQQQQQQELFDLSKRRKPLLLASILLGLACTVTYKSMTIDSNPVPAIAYMMVCMANGIQNSFTSTVSSNLCRTTHMTGTYTDVCTILGQCIKGDTSKAYKLKIYGRLISAFWLGGILGGLFVSSSIANTVPIALGLSSMFYLLSSLTPSPKNIGKKLRLFGGRRHRHDNSKP